MLSTTPSSTSGSQSRCSVQRLRPSGRGAAGELDQARLGGAIELRQAGGLVLSLALERTRQPLHHAALAHPLDRGTADLQLLHDVLVGQAVVRSERDLGTLDREGGGLAARAPLLECRTFFGRQIRFINYKLLFRLETRFKYQFFSMFRSQHIEIDANVCVIKSFLEKG